MSTAYLIDTYGMPSDSELRMAGCVGASRYISHSSGKAVTAGQVKHIHSLGKLVQLNFEDSATNAKGGAAQGRDDAEFTLAVLHQIGAPKGVAVYFSVDFETHTGYADIPVVIAYFKAVWDVLKPAGYLVGAYSDADVLTALFGAKIIDLGWQTVAWSYGKRNPEAVELQDTFTQGYDKDEILHPFIGAWTPTGPQFKPAPEDDMSAADQAAINAHTDKAIAALEARIKADLEAAITAINVFTNKMASLELHGDAQHPNSLDSIAKEIKP